MKKHFYTIISGIISLILLALPYYMFRGQLYIGGDDTRLYYHYPTEFLQQIAFSSWNSFSSFGFNNPNQFYIPFLFMVSFIRTLIHSEMIVNYLAFSLPLVTGFLSMRLLLKSILGDNASDGPAIAGALLYILSPITILHQISVFLGIWFLAILPLMVYYYVQYLKSSNFFHVVKASIIGVLFSVGFIAIPWMIGFILPLIVGGAFLFILGDSGLRRRLLLQTPVYIFFVIAAQSFWVLPFIQSAFGSQQSFAGTALSSDVAATFASTVGVTASGNVLYPLLNLPQRQLAFDFNWDIKYLFEQFYDRILIINIWYGVLFFWSFLLYKRRLSPILKKLYIVGVIAYVFSLFVLTVNIGPLKYLFLQFGRIPGFSMFRNFYDKFALGYIFLSALILSFSLFCIVKGRNKAAGWIVSLTLLIIVINALPIRSIVNAPLWGTAISRETKLPHEYKDFLSRTSAVVTPSSNVLVLPFNIASYAIIPGSDKHYVYVGTSPTKIISSINSISGGFSFFGKDATEIRDLIIQRNYGELRKFLAVHNIGYVMVQKNIPGEVLSSYLFDKEFLPLQDEQLIQNIAGDLLITSSDGNYLLYKTRVPTGLFETDKGTVEYTRIHSGFFYVTIYASESAELRFRDSYHDGWDLYPAGNVSCSKSITAKAGVNECKHDTQWKVIDELQMLFSAPISQELQSQDEEFGNMWKIYPTQTTLKVYFTPQRFFYIGIIMSAFVFAVQLLILAILQRRRI